jgi:DNA polymerase-3 subunit gamma/tau
MLFMSYQVLARKWRPRNFQELVGQEHVLQPLVNALIQQRLHHAYLFTGTRGVGKTTIARILARCLNCETQITAEPCGQCTACQEITSGRFVDLIEVDAASRTRVEDTRELLDNIQYAPTHGRFKIYLIDEVHMLSNHSFNALLKTLEEPPSHVKFLLATTDPQRLPVTILSRCLQFHLKNLAPELIAGYLQTIVAQENLSAEPEALMEIGLAADGSLRDALSLLDQAIAYCQGKIVLSSLHAMLGSVGKDYLYAILTALKNGNGQSLLETIDKMAMLNADFNRALADLLSLLHKLSIYQIVPDSTFYQEAGLIALAKQFQAADIQLFYQIGLLGRRDLPLAPSARVGFEMTLLRMLAFYPLSQHKIANETSPTREDTKLSQPAIQAKSQPLSGAALPQPETLAWADVIPQLKLVGMTLALASHCVFKRWDEQTLELSLAPKHKPLLNDKMLQRFSDALKNYYQKPIKLDIQLATSEQLSPAEQVQAQREQQQLQAEQVILQDEHVKTIISQFDAKLVSTQPLNK